MNMQLHKFQVVGLFPLLTHNPAGMQPATNGPKVKRIPSREDEAISGLYLDSEGNFCIPSVAFRSALLNGLKNQKVGKKSAISVFQAAVFNTDELTVLLDPESGDPITSYTIDTRRAIIQKNGILRSRPRFEKWACYVHFLIDYDITDAEQVAEALNNAGMIIGVGDFRIERRGMFGRFEAEWIKD